MRKLSNQGLNLSLKFLHPGFCSLECVGVGDIIDDDGGLGSSVVHGGQTVIPLLARSVPDLKLDRRVIKTNCLGQKCCSDSRLGNRGLYL